MGLEIERKFLVDPSLWSPQGEGTLFRQGYLSSAEACVVRVRLAGDEAFLTVKGATSGVTRLEFEYRIPREDAMVLLDMLCGPAIIEKTRYRRRFGEKLWEIDVFHGENDGLIVAEVELLAEDEVLELPEWVAQEVSDDPRYFNSNLMRCPFNSWA
ncbi:CYTH domain-containing protein [Methylocystis bryophila]|uniref:Adenylate cyclase n=1 Tax=Methylocystis bryophila TaxID=655015 RepID=A0A1W6MQE5_9HYPH|nr:CYTH domain-containing protein [Methylocystis bryophila]ARN79830.1 adenylate cyclase [Methylocystis bryophila]BDV39714.1 CYTH domain-containing protein [Methylocystis bryophila]